MPRTNPARSSYAELPIADSTTTVTATTNGWEDIQPEKVLKKMNILAILSFVWKNVIPALKEIFNLMGADIYDFIKNRVDDADVLDMSGLEKRTKVYAEAREYLREKGVEDDDISALGAVAIYFLIEIAVYNLRRKSK